MGKADENGEAYGPTPIGRRLKRMLKIAFRARINVLLEGVTGIGKSAIYEQIAEELGIEVRVVDLSLLEPPDLVGLPIIKDGETVYARPRILPTEGRGMAGNAGARRSLWKDHLAQLLAGLDPGKKVEELESTGQPPHKLLDWKKAVQMFVGVVRKPTPTYGRPSRRFPDNIGQIPGRVHGRVKDRAPPLIAAIDTSSSMSSAELARIARQLTPLSRLVDITIVECDSRIRRVYPFKGEVKSITGRGGTDLRPVFGPDFLQKHRPDGIIYFTDGEGPYPPKDPGVKTLWVLTKPAPFGCAWGTKALLPDEDHPSS